MTAPSRGDPAVTCVEKALRGVQPPIVPEIVPDKERTTAYQAYAEAVVGALRVEGLLAPATAPADPEFLRRMTDVINENLPLRPEDPAA